MSERKRRNGPPTRRGADSDIVTEAVYDARGKEVGRRLTDRRRALYWPDRRTAPEQPNARSQASELRSTP